MRKIKLTQAKAIIIASAITAVAAILGGFFAIQATIQPIKLQINATQTAEARTNLRFNTPFASIEPVNTTPPSLPLGAAIRLDTQLDYDWFEVGSIYTGEPKINKATTIYTEPDGMVFFKNLNLEEQLLPTNIRTCETERSDTLELGVTSLVKDEWIRFENTPLIRIVNIKPITLSGSLHVISQENAGAGSFGGQYWIQFRSTDMKQEAKKAKASDNTNLPDFFTLQPGEQEWLKISMYCLEPGEYEIEIGINYLYNGVNETIWTNKITLVAPDRYYYWKRAISSDPDYFLYGFIQWDTTKDKWMFSPPSYKQWLVP